MLQGAWMLSLLGNPALLLPPIHMPQAEPCSGPGVGGHTASYRSSSLPGAPFLHPPIPKQPQEAMLPRGIIIQSLDDFFDGQALGVQDAGAESVSGGECHRVPGTGWLESRGPFSPGSGGWSLRSAELS